MSDRDDYLRGIVDVLEEGVRMVDPDRRLLHWNREAERLTGFSSHDVLGARCCEDFISHVDERGQALPAERCPLSKTLADGRTRVKAAFLRDSRGRLVRVSLRTAAIRGADGRIVGAVEIFRKPSADRAVVRRLSALEKLAHFDPLTGLPNRRLLEARLKEFLSETTRYGRRFGVVMIDVDSFKSVNDSLGHAVGDRVLEIVGKTLRSSSRPFDVVGRWGGDEFLALVKNVEEAQLEAVVEKLRRRVAECRLVVEGQALRVTVSCGAMLASRGLTAEAVVGAADARMYQRRRQARRATASSAAPGPA
ncbi:MAG: diguanylate cyclase [Thermoanaerobaculia bacterium]